MSRRSNQQKFSSEKYRDKHRNFGLKYERSCGAIVFREINEELRVLLVQHSASHWSFPKGHVEKGESDYETAIREVREETGIDIEITSDFSRASTYSPYPGARKTVVFFIGDYLGGSLRPQLEEVQRVAWLKPEDSMKYLVFDRDREIFNDALQEIGYEVNAD
ncbi:MAG: NUDIX domain-containing protein [Clostridiaceae bacterium]|jgi:8-oxo-dGTP pyrophosphatase MutT (NUDIX family)|nr:NUDIX domain-containing protein [Clostridiaceae bacterium]